MKKPIILSLSLIFTATVSQISSAMPPQPGERFQPSHRSMMMPKPMQHPDVAPRPIKRQLFPGFPSPEELARMAPPEPMTEDKIKQRFAKRLADLNESLDRDRKQAEKYAKDFARLQKFQADRLAEIMAQAEKRREAMVERLKQREQQVLEQFRQQQQPAAEKAPAAKADQEAG